MFIGPLIILFNCGNEKLFVSKLLTSQGRSNARIHPDIFDEVKGLSDSMDGLLTQYPEPADLDIGQD